MSKKPMVVWVSIMDLDNPVDSMDIYPFEHLEQAVDDFIAYVNRHKAFDNPVTSFRAARQVLIESGINGGIYDKEVN